MTTRSAALATVALFAGFGLLATVLPTDPVLAVGTLVILGWLVLVNWKVGRWR